MPTQHVTLVAIHKREHKGRLWTLCQLPYRWVKAGVGGVPRLYNPATRTGMFYIDMTNATVPTNTTCSFGTQTNVFRPFHRRVQVRSAAKPVKATPDAFVAERLSKEDKATIAYGIASDGHSSLQPTKPYRSNCPIQRALPVFRCRCHQGHARCIEEWLQSDDSAFRPG